MASFKHVGALPLVLNAGQPDERHIAPGESFDADASPEEIAFWVRTGAIQPPLVIVDDGDDAPRRRASDQG